MLSAEDLSKNTSLKKATSGIAPLYGCSYEHLLARSFKFNFTDICMCIKSSMEQLRGDLVFHTVLVLRFVGIWL